MESTPAPAKQWRRTTLLALPYDVVVDIVGLVAATSTQPFSDLRSVSAACKAMYAATKESNVLRRVALEKENTMKWCNNNRYLTVLKNLAGAGNTEACFLCGLMHVFTQQGKQSGLNFLKEAAAAGHKTAAYLLGIVLYSADDTRDIAKQYIRQVEANSCASIGCETNMTNRECQQCRHVVMYAILEMRDQKIAVAPNEVLRASYYGRCMNEGCDLSRLSPDYKNVFCSEDCIMRYECSLILALNSCYKVLCEDAKNE